MEHVSAYASLIHQEASTAGADLVTRAVAWVLTVLAGVVFLGLAGTAVMIGFVHQFHWALVVVPGIALLLAVVAGMRAMKPMTSERFPELKAQIQSDAQALRVVA